MASVCKYGHVGAYVKGRCTECRRAASRQRYRENAEFEKARAIAWRKANPEKWRELCGRARTRNADRIKERKKRAYYQMKSNPEKMRAYRESRRVYMNARNQDIVQRLKGSLRARVRSAVRRVSGRVTATDRIIGISIEGLRDHLASRFAPGMSWENYGAWEIDHIIPLASAASATDVLALCHYSNLQPLWRSENRAKGAKVAA